jgi:hypothetical protein
VSFLGLSDDEADRVALDSICYPEPDERHPVGAQAQRRKIHVAQADAGDVPIYAFAHGYGPLADVKARTALAFEAADGRIWLNRYGYLSDEKLDAVGEVTGAARAR